MRLIASQMGKRIGCADANQPSASAIQHRPIDQPLRHCTAKAADEAVLFDRGNDREVVEAFLKHRIIERFDGVIAHHTSMNPALLQEVCCFAHDGQYVACGKQTDVLALAQHVSLADGKIIGNCRVDDRFALFAQSQITGAIDLEQTRHGSAHFDRITGADHGHAGQTAQHRDVFARVMRCPKFGVAKPRADPREDD